MRIEFISRHSNTSKLILISAGWGSDKESYSHISMPGWDVAVVFMPEDETPFTDITISKYSTIYLYAWSLGVATAELFLNCIKPTKAFAINGTYNPISDDRGIPEDIYFGTMTNLTQKNFVKFQRRMFSSIEQFRQYSHLFSQTQNISSLQRQLQLIYSHKNKLNHYVEPTISWTCAFIGDSDRIFPMDSQINAWNSITDIEILNAGHFIDIADIVHRTIINKEKVKDRFSRRLSTYSDSAVMQRQIASRLYNCFIKPNSDFVRNVLEVGCGTGLLTSQWSKSLHPNAVCYIDLCELTPFKIIKNEQYIVGDAEQVIETFPENINFDAIFSASAIQWFSNLPRFFSSCYHHLNEGGYIAMSSFIPGNLPEISTHHSPLSYYNVSDLRLMLSPLYKDIDIISEEIVMEFESPVEALRHLQYTGVTGLPGFGIPSVRKLLNDFPLSDNGRYQLTFLPVYIFARK